MPTYDYRCANCEHEFEQFQSITAAPLVKCPKCGKRKLRRLIGAGAGIIFKGSGFYQTDYRSDGYKKAAEAESKGAAGSSDKSTGADAKPASGAAASSTGDGKPAGKTDASKKGRSGDAKPHGEASKGAKKR